MAKVNLLIVSGRKLLREGLTLLLKEHADLRVVGEADELERGLKLLEPLAVKAVVLNLSSPTQIGADLVRQLVAASAGVRVIVLASNPNQQCLRAVLDAGAAACLTKECSSEELVRAIRSAVAGQVYLSPRLMGMVVNNFARPDRPPVGRALAPREREVLRQIASGRTTKEIAYELGVSTKTIETHRRRLMEKLDRFSVAELTQYAVMEGLIALEVPA